MQGFAKRADLGRQPGHGQKRGAIGGVEIEAVSGGIEKTHFVHIGRTYNEMSDPANAAGKASEQPKSDHLGRSGLQNISILSMVDIILETGP
ncbi:MAG: hypothetical protein KDH19_04955 [Geminicoccaceae bacterium]|nr:hypothetical protein [Geminicoccaceae bacterium]